MYAWRSFRVNGGDGLIVTRRLAIGYQLLALSFLTTYDLRLTTGRLAVSPSASRSLRNLRNLLPWQAPFPPHPAQRTRLPEQAQAKSQEPTAYS
jgi:hypothetical protein